MLLYDQNSACSQKYYTSKTNFSYGDAEKWVFEYLTAFFLIKSKKYKKVYKKDNFQIKIIFFSYSTTLIQLCLSLITN